MIQDGAVRICSKYDRQAIRLFQEIGDSYWEGMVHIGLGDSYVHLGQYAAAERELQRGLARQRDVNDTNGQGFAHSSSESCVPELRTT